MELTSQISAFIKSFAEEFWLTLLYILWLIAYISILCCGPCTTTFSSFSFNFFFVSFSSESLLELKWKAFLLVLIFLLIFLSSFVSLGERVKFGVIICYVNRWGNFVVEQNFNEEILVPFWEILCTSMHVKLQVCHLCGNECYVMIVYHLHLCGWFLLLYWLDPF